MTQKTLTVEEFTAGLASGDPTPGGGSAAAVAGSHAAALAAMVARLTVGREKYKDAWADMESLMAEADALRLRLLDLAEADSDAYVAVTDAFRLPKGTPEEKDARGRAVQVAMQGAAEAPLGTLEAVAAIPSLARRAVEKGNPNCLTDAGVAAQLALAAATGAAYNVRINLTSISDADYVRQTAARTDALLERVRADVVALAADVDRRLAGLA